MPNLRRLDSHPNFQRNPVVSEDNKKHPLDMMAAGIIVAVASSVIAGIVIMFLGWISYKVNTGAEVMVDMSARAVHVEKNQNELKATLSEFSKQQAKTHEALILMSATHATKDDLIKEKQILSERIEALDARIRALEQHNGTRL